MVHAGEDVRGEGSVAALGAAVLFAAVVDGASEGEGVGLGDEDGAQDLGEGPREALGD